MRLRHQAQLYRQRSRIQGRRLIRTRRPRVSPRLGELSLLVMLIVIAASPFGSAPIVRAGRAQDAKARKSQSRAAQGSMEFGPFQKLSDGKPTMISPADQADLAEAMSVQKGRRRTGQRVARPKVPGAPVARVPGTAATYLVLSVEFDSPASLASFKLPGVTVFADKDRFADVFVEPKPAVLDQLRSAPGIVWLEAIREIQVPPPPIRPRTLERTRGEDTTEEIIRGGLDGLTGKGTIIAIVDSGVDFRNPDFITYDAAGRPTSRLLYLWDTTANDSAAASALSKPPLSYPNRAPVGMVYTRAQLTAALRAERGARPSGIRATDPGGHGTACAGIAAGNGNNSKDTTGQKRTEVIGVAPEAEIIAVKIDDDSTPSIENGFLLNAICEWLDVVAGQRPLVISCSFGAQRGGRDGYRIDERQLDARFPLNRQGRVIVVAAGNEASNDLHAEVDVGDKNAPGIFSWEAEKDGALLEIYFANGDLTDLEYATSTGSRVEAAAYVNPITKKAVAVVRTPAGRGSLAVFNSSGQRVNADAYIAGGRFNPGMASSARQVGTPGTTNNAITVGSYDWNSSFNYQGRRIRLRDHLQKEITIGQLSAYSNPGFSRNGAVKPEIVAPGQYYHASYAKLWERDSVNAYNAKPNSQGRVPDTSGNYMLFNGTSAATPYTAGVIALMFEKKPTLTLGQIRELLKNNASQDRFTSTLPNPAWGYGKLDLTAVRKILGAI